MRKPYLLIALLLLLSFVLVGCLDFGKDEETTSPTKSQLSRCQSEMYLNPLMQITPLGYKLEGSGIDDIIWFKFKTNLLDMQEIFDRKVVDTSKFKDDFTLTSNVVGLTWWDVTGKKFFGGQVELPNVRFMSVGIERDGNGYMVYIIWHEM